MKVYVPTLNSGNCVVVRDSNVIRVYDSTPSINTTINYTDYYYNSHYMQTKGSQSFSNYSTIPVCLSASDVTTDVYYRLDLDNILVCFFIIVIICFYFPFRIISRMFGRWLKL